MLRAFVATSVLALIVSAAPAQAQTQQERDDKACAEQGAGPDTDGYSACIAQRKIDRFQQAQKRAADIASMPKGYRVDGGGTGLDPQTGGYAMKTGPLPNEMMYLMPEGTRALEGVQTPEAKLSVTKTQVCVTEGDPAKIDAANSQPKDNAATPQASGDAANPATTNVAAKDDASKPRDDAANSQAICQTNVEVTKKEAPPRRPDPRNDPHNPLTHSYMHPGDIFNDHTQF